MTEPLFVDYDKYKLIGIYNFIDSDVLYEYLIAGNSPDAYISRHLLYHTFDNDTTSVALKTYLEKYPDRDISITALAVFNIIDYGEEVDIPILIYLNAAGGDFSDEEKEYMNELGDIIPNNILSFIDSSPSAPLECFYAIDFPENDIVNYVKLGGYINMKEFDRDDHEVDLLIISMQHGYDDAIDAILQSSKFNPIDFDYISYTGLNGPLIKKLYKAGVTTTNPEGIYFMFEDLGHTEYEVDDNLKLGLFYCFLAGTNFDKIYKDMNNRDPNNMTRWMKKADNFDELFRTIQLYTSPIDLFRLSVRSAAQNNIAGIFPIIERWL